MVKIVGYHLKNKKEWNEFLEKSKNGVFLFSRDYMDYHSDRFVDHSYMVYEKGRLVSLLPANIDKDIVTSHSGLTFGGFITDSSMKAELMLSMFEALQKTLSAQSVTKLIYKPIPHIYHSAPAEEDLYALSSCGSKLTGCSVSSTVFQEHIIEFSKIRQRQNKKAEMSGLTVELSNDFASYWDILTKNLKQQHDKAPIHSIDEIQSLQRSFPDNIKLFCAQNGSKPQAGVVIYESSTVAHAQYIASSEEGKKSGALDSVFTYLIEKYYRGKKYFDFGISTDHNGTNLNSGLIQHKESFGARAIVYNRFELNL